MIRSLSENRRAFFELEIIEKIEAGLKLTGPEVKSIWTRGADLNGSYIKIIGGEIFVLGMKIAPYGPAAQKGYDPARIRKVLLNRNEINSLVGLLSRKGYGAVPIRLYPHRRLIKMEIGLGRGKRKADRRDELRERDLARDTERLVGTD